MYFKKTFIALTIILGLLITISTAKADTINIKGLEIGMSKKDIKKQIKEIRIKSKWLNAKLIPHYYMTLAGVESSLPRVWYDKDKNVQQLAWFFCYDNHTSEGSYGCQMQGDQHSPKSFKIVADALLNKFDMECTTETLQNPFGATQEDRTCYYHDDFGNTISTERFEDEKGFTQGRISIYPTDTFMANLEKLKTGAGDL